MNHEFARARPTSPRVEPPDTGLYVHVPFCARKCAYCDFASLPDGPDRPAQTARYFDALARELQTLPDAFHPRTLYLGGGTPTALGAAGLERLLRLLRESAELSRLVEATCEANPGTLDRATLDALRAGGVNRISIGAQSFQTSILSRLGRIHSPAQIIEAVRAARNAEFDNLGLDLIFGSPGSSADTWRDDLDRVIELNPEHLSLYALTLESGAPLARERDAGRFTETSDEDMADAYEFARGRLASAGYEQIEISNFARPGRACRHNELYWSGGEYIGLGPSAHSHWAGRRWENFQDLEEYASALSKTWKEVSAEEVLDPEAKAVETLLFSLRRLKGVQRPAFRAQTGFDLDALRGPALRELLERGLLKSAPPDGIRLAPNALFVSDTVFRELA